MGLIVKVAGTTGEVQNGPPLPGSQLRAEVAIGRRPACMQAGEDRSGPIMHPMQRSSLYKEPTAER